MSLINWGQSPQVGDFIYLRLIITDTNNISSTQLAANINNIWSNLTLTCEPMTAQTAENCYVGYPTNDTVLIVYDGGVTGGTNNGNASEVTTGTYYIQGTWNGTDWTLSGLNEDPLANLSPITNACFGITVLNGLIDILKTRMFVIIVKYKRQNTKMYRIYDKKFGPMEFTYNHPFNYKNKIYMLESLLNKNLFKNKKIESIPYNDKNNGYDSYVYNVICDFKQISDLNKFELNGLTFYGAKYNNNISFHFMSKKLNIISNIIDHPTITKHFYIEEYVKNTDNYNDEEIFINKDQLLY